ncbi:MAG: bifunctional adenosylcobinamide kinase/adenosylcobinamide-phosphate guanylyltransferase [Lachnospiraceae bacterium]
MLVLVTGGSRSGKSAIAESIAEQLYGGEKIYLATMLPCDRECEERICQHRLNRAGKGYITLEKGTHLEEIQIKRQQCVLLECISNLVANEMYDVTGVKTDVVEHIRNGILHLKKQTEHLVIVTNEVFSDVVEDEETKRYVQQMGLLNQALAASADVFIEAVCGICVIHKGEERMKGK